MRERIENKYVTKEIKSQMPVIPMEIIKEKRLYVLSVLSGEL